MIAPADVPLITGKGLQAVDGNNSAIALRTPTWNAPRAPPPGITSPMLLHGKRLVILVDQIFPRSIILPTKLLLIDDILDKYIMHLKIPELTKYPPPNRVEGLHILLERLP